MLLASSLAATGLFSVGQGPALAAYNNIPEAGWRANGTVYAMAVSDSRVFIGGDFTSVFDVRTGQTVSRSRLAAFDRDTGDLVAWNPGVVNATVRALALSEDGGAVFVGGDFTSINGQTRTRIAAINTVTGQPLPGWSASANDTVRDFVVHDGSLYVGGLFGVVDSRGRVGLARLRESDGGLVDGWNPGVGNGRVLAIGLAPATGGSSLIVGGSFTTLDGDPQRFLGSVDLESGARRDQWSPAAECTSSCYVLDITADAQNVYTAIAGPGGRLASYTGATGARRWVDRADGDVQAVALYDGIVYAGGHFDPVFNGRQRHQLVAVNAATGALRDDFAPALQRPYPGVWALHADADGLWAGGGFLGVAALPAQHRFAFFPTIDSTDDATLIDRGATWRYFDTGQPAGDWRAVGYDDSSWASGPAELGFGDGDEATVIAGRRITTYFRRTINVTDPGSFATLRVELVRDDGAVVYLNGTEIARSNMPAGTPTDATLASATLGGAQESEVVVFDTPAGLLRPGSNVIAVEVHQAAATSSDISFDLALRASQ
jgi:hypothetical protein